MKMLDPKIVTVINGLKRPLTILSGHHFYRGAIGEHPGS